MVRGRVQWSTLATECPSNGVGGGEGPFPTFKVFAKHLTRAPVAGQQFRRHKDLSSKLGSTTKIVILGKSCHQILTPEA